MIRAKFVVTSVTSHHHSDAKTVRLHAVTADEVPENQRYHKYTPAGSLEITITNPAVADQLPLGAAFYLDFTPSVADQHLGFTPIPG